MGHNLGIDYAQYTKRGFLLVVFASLSVKDLLVRAEHGVVSGVDFSTVGL
jgi:hypothetical protein